MAQIFSTPAGFREPPSFDAYCKDGKFDRATMDKVDDEYLAELSAWCKKNTDSKSPLVGKIIRIGIADGYAQYMIYRTQPFQLLHIPLGDAWNVPDYQTRGLRVSDAKQMVERDHNLGKLFGRR